jgi:hypothetical protein
VTPGEPVVAAHVLDVLPRRERRRRELAERCHRHDRVLALVRARGAGARQHDEKRSE